MKLKSLFSDFFSKHELRNSIREVASFGVIGIISTVIFYVLYLVITGMSTPHIGYFIAYVISLTFNVTFNIMYTFNRTVTSHRIISFITVYLVSMAAGAGALSILLHYSLSEKLAGLAVVGFVAVINFTGMRIIDRLLS